MFFMGVCRLLRRLVGSCNAEPVRGGSLTGSAAEELDGVCAGAVDDLAAFITFKMMSILACLGLSASSVSRRASSDAPMAFAFFLSSELFILFKDSTLLYDLLYLMLDCWSVACGMCRSVFYGCVSVACEAGR